MTSPQPEPGLQPEWMDLKTIQRYVCVCERTVRDWIRRPTDPLPAVQVARGKILVKRDRLDKWLEGNAFRSGRALALDQIVDDVMRDLQRAN